jgi:hypothetical protein
MPAIIFDKTDNFHYSKEMNIKTEGERYAEYSIDYRNYRTGRFLSGRVSVGEGL